MHYIFPSLFSWDNFFLFAQEKEFIHVYPGKLNFTHLNLKSKLKLYREPIVYIQERHISEMHSIWGM